MLMSVARKDVEKTRKPSPQDEPIEAAPEPLSEAQLETEAIPLVQAPNSETAAVSMFCSIETCSVQSDICIVATVFDV